MAYFVLRAAGETAKVREIILPEGLATPLATGHPWVYRDHIPREKGKTGSWVKVRAGSFQAFGLWDEESPIAVRIFSAERVPDKAWFLDRVREAWELRAPLRARGTTGYRWVSGEGDGIPGLVVDLYGSHAVVMTYSKALGSILDPVVEALREVGNPRGIVRRIRRDEGVEIATLFGDSPPHELTIVENGMVLGVDVYHGQKTGLFFDHRDNRDYVREIAEGRTMLNLFSYTGGFTVSAGLGGASSLTSVDIAAPAIAAACENLHLNGLSSVPHEGAAEDVFQFLERALAAGKKWQLVVCDPPSFAKNRDQKKAAERAYVRLMSLALKVVEPGGILCAASCTSQIGPPEFRRLLSDAARKSRVRCQIVREAGQALDHPILVGHEEGRYLKFIAVRVGPRV
jgi:23S rRNA (cytosine1962-C5)-methyltransferase